MKIQITDGPRRFTIPLPNALVLSRPVLKLALRGTSLSSRDAGRLLGELRKLGTRERPWELVRVESKKGEIISILI